MIRAARATASLVLGTLLATAYAPALAQEEPPALGGLHNLRVLLDKAAMDYQMFKGENGNPRYNQTLDETLERIDDTRERITAEAIPEQQRESLRTMKGHVDTFLKLLRDNRERIAGGGYEEYSLVDRMYDEKQKAQALAAEIYSATGSDVDKSIQRIRDLSFLMQRMAAAYIEQAASAFGTAYRGQGDEKPVDQLAREFSEGLNQLSLESADNPSIKVMMNQVERRWSFIKQSMLNYKENTVPFLVYRYSNAIVDDLLTIADLQTGGGPGSLPDDGNVPLPPNMPGAGGASDARTEEAG